MPSIVKQPLPKVENGELFDFLRKMQSCFAESNWTPFTTNITNIASVTGAYQRLNRIVFVVASFASNGSLNVASNATLRLPMPAYERNSVFPFSAHEFKFSDQTSGAITTCWMDPSSGLIKPTASIAAGAHNLAFSGWYYTE